MSEQREKGELEAVKQEKNIEKLRSQLVVAIDKGDLEKWKKIVNECEVENGERAKLLNSLSSNRNHSLLHSATWYKQASIISWLLSDKEGEGRSSGFSKALTREADTGRTALHFAAWRGSLKSFLATMEGLRVDNGERQEMLNAVDCYNRSILHLATESENAPIISWILSEEGGRAAGFDRVLSRTCSGETALHVAAWKGDVESFLAVVDGLRVDNGERQEMLNAIDGKKDTVLHRAAELGRPSIVLWILSEEGGRAAGFNSVLARNAEQQTALHHVAGWRGDLESFLAVVNGLRVDNGERQEMLNALDKEGLTILHIAAQCGREEIISWILSEEGGRAAGFYSVLARTRAGATALHMAASSDTLEVFLAVVNGLRVDNGKIPEMLNAVDNGGRTVLHIAAQWGREEIVRWILSEEGGRAAGFNSVLAKTTDDLLTALHYAVQKPSPDTARDLLSHCTSEERMNLFLAADKHGWTALHCAARCNRGDAISLLLSHPECGLIVSMKDNLGMTALHRAIIGGLDEKSRKEWDPYVFRPDGKTISTLLGLSSSSSTTTTTAKGWIDPNIGLGLL